MEFRHVPVLLNECLEGLNISANGVYLDGTIGGGGHSEEILKRLDGGRLYANDRDIEAIQASKGRLQGYSNITYIQGNYKDLPNKIEEKLDGILLDLGVSSYQIDNGDRGFSYMQDAPLDMRMDLSGGKSAKDIVNNYSLNEISNIIRKYGEDNFAGLIAKSIVREREKAEIKTTLELAKIVENSIPAKMRWKRGHPAKKTFQAIRIEVNEELSGLYEAIIAMTRMLKIGGRICIISFHSLEDRIVKNAFRELEKDCICDKSAPICICDKVSEIKIITRKPMFPKEEELIVNERSKSAKLRIAEKKE